MGAAAEGAGVVSVEADLLRAMDAYDAAEDAYHDAEWRVYVAADAEDSCARMAYVYRDELRSRRCVAFGASVIAAIVTVALLLVLALPAHAEPPRLTEARTAQTLCVLREYRTRTASAGVSAREAALVARLGAEHACALEGWARALGGVDALAVATATRAPVLIERVGETTYMSRDRGLTWIDVLSHGGACALCGGGVALGAWAACGGAR